MQPSPAKPPSSSNAVDNNKKLFSVFAKKLAQNDNTVFTDYTDRLATWLSDSRAYYDQARPEIIKALTIAYGTVRRNAAPGLGPNEPFHIAQNFEHPMVAPYNRLMQRVYHHRDRFTESDLQRQLRDLLGTVLKTTITTPSAPAYIDLTKESPVEVVHNTAPTIQQISQPTSVAPQHVAPISFVDPRALQTHPSPPVNTTMQKPHLLPNQQTAQGRMNTYSTTPRFPLVPANFASSGPAPLPFVHQLASGGHPIPSYHPGVPTVPHLSTSQGASGSAPGHNGHATITPPSRPLGALPQSPDVSLSSPFSADPFTQNTSASNIPTKITNVQPLPTQVTQIQQIATNPAQQRQNSAPAMMLVAGTNNSEAHKPPTPTQIQLSRTPPAILTRISTFHKEPTMVASPLSMTPVQTLPTLSRPPSSAGVMPISASMLASKSSASSTPVLTSQNGTLASSPPARTPMVRSSTTPNPAADPRPPLSRPASTASLSTASNPVRKARRKTKLQLGDLIARDLKAHQGRVQGNVKTEAMDDAYLLSRPSVPVTSSGRSLTDRQGNEREIITISDDEEVSTIPIAKTSAPPIASQTTHVEGTENGVPLGTGQDQSTKQSTIGLSAGSVDLGQNEVPDTESISTGVDVEMKDDTIPQVTADIPIKENNKLAAGMLIEPPMNFLTPPPGLEVSSTDTPKGVGIDEGEKKIIAPSDSMQEETAHLPLSMFTEESEVPIYEETPVTVPPPNVVEDVPMLNGTTDHGTILTEKDRSGELGLAVAVATSPSLIPAASTFAGQEQHPGLGPTLSERVPQGKSKQNGLASVVSGLQASLLFDPFFIPPGEKPETRRQDVFSAGSQCPAQVPGQGRKCSITLTITVESSKYERVLAWRDRRMHSRPLENTYCYTLWSYPAGDKRIGDEMPSLDTEPPSTWPLDGHLTMQARFKGKEVIFPMSPPLKIGPYGMVDVTDFIDSKDCKIKLLQTSDMTSYHFVLRFHHPLPCQLEEAYCRRKKDERWNKWMLDLTKSFDTPLPSMIAAAS